MKKYAVCLGYLPMLGYSGFSRQPHDPQNILTIIISAIKKARLVSSEKKIDIDYASRTDRGVGAINQVISFNAKQPPILPEINYYLPDSIQALGMCEVSTSFNARRDAILRTYSYFLTTDEDFDIKLAHNILSMMIGRHDFRNFAKNDPKKEKNTIKDILIADIFPVGDNTYQVRLASKSFLWQQIRRIIGHLIEVSIGKYNSDYIRVLLEPNSVKPKPLTAPPENLILEEIKYKSIQFQYNRKALKSFQYTLYNHLVAARAKSALFKFFSDELKNKNRFI